MSYEIEWDSVVESESESAKIEAIADIEEELEDTAEPTGNSRLADADYSEAEKVDHKQHYGNEFVSNFVKNLPKSDLHKEYKV